MTIRNDTKIRAELEVDDPVSMDADWDFDEDERQKIDNQILAIEQHLVDALIRGRHGAWFDLSGSSAAVVPGDVVCLASAAGTVTKALAAALATAAAGIGTVVYAAAPGGKVFAVFGGILSPAITGLAAGSSGPIRINTATARLERVAALSVSDFGMGVVDNAGWAQLNHPTGPTTSDAMPSTAYAVNTVLTTSDRWVTATVVGLTLTLPASPVDGQTHAIKVQGGVGSSSADLALNSADGTLIDGAAVQDNIWNQARTIRYSAAIGQWETR